MGTEQDQNALLNELVATVQAAGKYRTVSADLIRLIGQRELAIRRNLKMAVKETKNKLHQVAGAYFVSQPRFAAWHNTLSTAAVTGDPTKLQAACRTVMAEHASTRERLPILADFYATLFATLPPVNTVLDIACGLNPLARPWMPLAPTATYYACDLYADLAQFLNEVLPLLGGPAIAEVRDVITSPPPWHADVAFVFKTLPVLEQVRRGAGRELLQAIDAPYLLVSFPTASLGGRGRGMAANYAAGFRELTASAGWPVEQFDFPGELVFLVRR